MRLRFLIFFLCLAVRVLAVDRITATVTITSGTSDGQTITVNGNVRTWKTTVSIPSSQILLDATAAIAKTNLFNQVALTPYSQISLLDNGSASIKLVGNSGLAMAVSFSAAYATVSYSTQTVASLVAVRVPISGEIDGGAQTNIASLLVKGQNDESTNKFYENAIAVQNLVGLTNNQTVAGIKLITNVAGQWKGIVSNSPAISGNVDTLTNGVVRGAFLISSVVSNAPAIIGNATRITNGLYDTPILRFPTLTNGVNYGDAFSSPGSGANSEQFGISATASGDESTAAGDGAQALGNSSTALGTGSEADDTSDTAVGAVAQAANGSATAIGAAAQANNTGSLAIGRNANASFDHSSAIGNDATTSKADQVMLGTSGVEVASPGYLNFDGGGNFGAALTNITFSGTNRFPAQSDISFGRYALSSLANGNNAGIVVGTNVFVEVSGPSGAFTINGIAGGRDGKYIIILNQTGQDLTFANQSGTDPTAANRIITMTGADRSTTGNGAGTLIYSGAASRWILISLDP